MTTLEDSDDIHCLEALRTRKKAHRTPLSRCASRDAIFAGFCSRYTCHSIHGPSSERPVIVVSIFWIFWGTRHGTPNHARAASYSGDRMSSPVVTIGVQDSVLGQPSEFLANFAISCSTVVGWYECAADETGMFDHDAARLRFVESESAIRPEGGSLTKTT